MGRKAGHGQAFGAAEIACHPFLLIRGGKLEIVEENPHCLNTLPRSSNMTRVASRGRTSIFDAQTPVVD